MMVFHYHRFNKQTTALRPHPDGRQCNSEMINLMSWYVDHSWIELSDLLRWYYRSSKLMSHI